MKLYLQFGWGMIEHSRELISQWGGGSVILSPRDLEPQQLEPTAAKINRIPGGAVLFDSQFYLPNSDHTRLCSHTRYWPQDYATGAFFVGSQLTKLVSDLRDLNEELDTAEVILPGLLATEISNDWLNIQKLILQEARKANIAKPLCQTIALSADACRNNQQIELLLEHTAEHSAESYYLVCEHPQGKYLVDDVAWLTNLVDIVAGLKLNGARVIVGYSSHQMLIAAIAKADAIASGTWMNVRSFAPEKFRLSYEEEIRQRAIWYYCPQALSEYKLPTLDGAQRVGILDLMAPSQEMGANLVASLFSGPQPSTLGLSEQAAFRHYLQCLNKQVAAAVKTTFDETVTYQDKILDDAEALLLKLNASRVRGQLRDFSEMIDTNRLALTAITQTRGPRLRRDWLRL